MFSRQFQKSDHQTKSAEPENTLDTDSVATPQHIPLWAQTPILQTKPLRVNQPGDRFEQEADEMAELIVQTMHIQRQEVSDEDDGDDEYFVSGSNIDEASLARQVDDEEQEDEILQTQNSTDTTPKATYDVERQISAKRGHGLPLSREIREPMERAFGTDFGDVRVHTDEQSNQLNQSLNARAFTTGQDIFFKQGEYHPGSSTGYRLLAHELTHVVQQSEQLVQKSTLEISRQNTETSADKLGFQGRKVEKYGIAYKKEGVNLRNQPNPNSKVLRRLQFNTRMYVHSEANGYYFIGTDDGQFGYVATSHVKTNLPEPNAKIYYIEPGDTALDISRKHYGGKAAWGSDHRFFVNGLVYVNRGEGDRGIYKPTPDADWDETKVRANYMIWVPSLKFMRSLQSVVKSGSITYETWQTVKKAATAVGEFLLGSGAFIVGLLHGALESIWDILVGLKDLVVLAIDLAKWFVKFIAGDGKGFFDSLKDINWSKLVEGWIDDFLDKWNHENILKKWHFRGWVIGYAIAEVLMLIFSGGIIQGIKWAGKAAKVGKVISKIPKVSKLAKAAKTSKTGQKLAKGITQTRKVGEKALDAIDIGGAAKTLYELGEHEDEIASEQLEDNIASVFYEGVAIDLPNEDQKQAGDSFAQRASDTIIIQRVEGHGNRPNVDIPAGDLGELKVMRLLREGRFPDLPQMDHVLRGQYDRVHGQDLFGFRWSQGNQLLLYRIEVKGGQHPKLGRSRQGPQTGSRWTEDVIGKIFRNDNRTNRALVTRLKRITGINNEQQLLRRLKQGRSYVVVSGNLTPGKIRRLQRALNRIPKRRRPRVKELKFPRRRGR